MQSWRRRAGATCVRRLALLTLAQLAEKRREALALAAVAHGGVEGPGRARGSGAARVPRRGRSGLSHGLARQAPPRRSFSCAAVVPYACGARRTAAARVPRGLHCVSAASAAAAQSRLRVALLATCVRSLRHPLVTRRALAFAAVSRAGCLCCGVSDVFRPQWHSPACLALSAESRRGRRAQAAAANGVPRLRVRPRRRRAPPSPIGALVALLPVSQTRTICRPARVAL
jgi:hypothetical protein